MTDQTIPADQARRARQWARDTLDDVENGANVSAYARDAARTLIAMMPRPTLADMTPEERAACQWMQADTNGGRDVISNPCYDQGRATILLRDGTSIPVGMEKITPRPDLPRMEWPGNQKPTPALPEGWRLADHKDHGRVIVTNTTPNRDGHVYFVIPDDDPMGYEWVFCDPDELTYLAQGDDTSDAVTTGTLAVGSEWNDIDALARACEESGRDQITVIDCEGDVSVWGMVAGWWETGLPSDGYEPFTIIHAGRKADQ